MLAAMFLGDTFNLIKYEKGSANVYDQKAWEGKLEVIDRSFTRSQYKLVETSTQAREFLDVNGAMSLRIKKGDLSVDGAGTYLKDMANRQKFVELLIRVQHETVTETIPSHIKPKTDWMSGSPDKIRKVGTHFVRSVTYGGELIASLKLKANSMEEREIIKAAVAANLQLTGTFDMNANGSFDKLRKDLAGMYNEDIRVMATTNPKSPPQTVEELMKIVEDYPKDIAKVNNGRGKAIRAELYPLTSLKSDFTSYLPNSAISALVNDVETKYDDIRVVKRDFYPWNIKRDNSTTEEDEEVEEFWRVLDAAYAAFHKAIANLDTSINGKVEQFKEAFAVYGTGKNNIPNRFQRWFWKLRHKITKEEIVWEKLDGSGAVYINWGSKKCPGEREELLYSGQAAGSLSRSFVGGRDFKCMRHSKPSISKPLGMQPKPSLLDAVEFHTLIQPDNPGIIPCAACLIPHTANVRPFYAVTSCPANWRLEYAGLTMADGGPNSDKDFMCLNKEIFEATPFSDGGDEVSRLNPVWINCPKGDGEKVVPCVVCSQENKIRIW